MNMTVNKNMNVRFLNDCSSYHAGSLLAAREMRRKMAEAGMVEQEPACLYVVNGEGTLHDDGPGARRLQKAIRRRPQGAQVCVINAVWQRMTLALEGVTMAVARESLSAGEMRADGLCADVRTVPDIALCCPHRPEHRGGEGLVVVDSVVPKVSAWLAEVAAALGARFLRLREWKDTPEALIDLMAGADGVVTGRYHGAVFAMLAGAPFMTVPSNTWKTEGMMRDMGVEGHHHTTAESVLNGVREGRFARVDRSLLAGVEERWSQVFQDMARMRATTVGPQGEGHGKSEGGRGAAATVNAAAKRPAEVACRPPTPSLWQAVKTVVLVGNGPSLIGARLGSLIDAHDEVVRFNRFRTRGFEKDTGCKTTLWSTFGLGLTPVDTPPPPRVVLVHEDRTAEGEPAEVFQVPRVFYRRLMKALRGRSKHAKAATIKPSSGFLVSMWLLENGCPHVNLAGFDHFGKQRSRKHHYWDGKNYARPSDHDGDAERELLLPFVMEGRVGYLC